MNESRFRELFQRYIDRDCSSQEEMELMQLLRDPVYEDIKNELIEGAYDHLPVQNLMTDEQADNIFGRIMRPVPVRRMIWPRLAVAASVLLMIAVATWLLVPQQNEIVALPQDVSAPDNNRAVVTLANGEKIYLDSAANGQLAMQGNMKIVKLANGQIAYETAAGEVMKEMQYNTLVNPRGSKVIDMTLSDGSKVWLNAGSSVTYPVAFIGSERKVEISGEAYFEVAAHVTASGAKQSFKVNIADKGEVEVLGTHFNVNAYDDEPDIKVTLLEGSVKVNKKNTLKPGQQAAIHDSQLTLHENADTEQVMAWKNGLFSFKSADIKTIMRQLSRWYDVEVEYTTAIEEKFHVEIDRNTNVSNVFKILETTGGVHFKIESRKIIVLP